MSGPTTFQQALKLQMQNLWLARAVSLGPSPDSMLSLKPHVQMWPWLKQVQHLLLHT